MVSVLRPVAPRARAALVAACIACIACLLMSTAPARADATKAEKAAEREYRLGYKALQAGDCTTAMTHYQRSYQLAPRPRTLFNMAACQEELGQDAEAWRSYHAFVDAAEPRDATIAAQARKRIEVLRGRLRGRVTIDSTPAGATVRIDGERDARGVTPVTLALTPGQHVVRISMPDAVAVERTLDVAPDEATSLSVTIALPSAISIRVDPADAVIEPRDGGPPAQGRLEAQVVLGRHEYTIRRAGFVTAHVVVDAVAGRTYEQQVTLRRLPDTATLVIAGAADATVTLDGAPPPGTPDDTGALAMRDLPAGRHALRVERAGHRPWHDDVHLSPGETVTVAVDLAPRRSATRRALAWGTGALGVAGLAGGSVLGVLALRDVTSDVADTHDRGKTRALLADGLFVVGVTAVIVSWRLLRGSSSTARIERSHEEP